MPRGVEVFQSDIFALPYADVTVFDIRSDPMIEHLSFLGEKAFFLETQCALCSGGKLILSVPDFEDTVRKWLAADNDWRDFYRNAPRQLPSSIGSAIQSYSTKSRRGYLIASIFGPQNSEEQFHKNCHTDKKSAPCWISSVLVS